MNRIKKLASELNIVTTMSLVVIFIGVIDTIINYASPPIYFLLLLMCFIAIIFIAQYQINDIWIYFIDEYPECTKSIYDTGEYIFDNKTYFI
jgi:hypothetical protein